MQRLETVAHHLIPVDGDQDLVRVRVLDNGCAHIVLNRPKALNSLTKAMFRRIHTLLRGFEDDVAVKLVVVTSESRAFCAGGDLKEFSHRTEGGRSFCWLEYRLDSFIHHMKTPVLSLIDGIVMGGGAGISISGRYRVATENIIFAMPEAKVGFFTDVGATWYLAPRNSGPGMAGADTERKEAQKSGPEYIWQGGASGWVGSYLCMTASQIQIADCLYCNVATHFLPRSRLDSFKEALFSQDLSAGVVPILRSFCDYHPMPAPIEKRVSTINECFSASTVEEILERLQVHTKRDESDEESDWARQTIETIRRMCPTSIKAIHEQMTRAKQLATFPDCMSLEFRLGCRLWQRADLVEGVRYVLELKSSARPRWVPDNIEDCPLADVLSLFRPFDDPSVEPELSFDENAAPPS